MKIIDLSQTIENKMEVYPKDPEVLIEDVLTLEKEGWNVSKITMGSHTGTHVDAFSHMVDGGTPLDEIPLESFIGRAIMVEDFDLVGKEKLGLVFKERVNLDVFDRIIKCKAKFVAGDISEELERKLLKNGIITFTDLINLDLLPINEEFIFIGLPLKFKNGNGSPVRAIAILE